MAAAATVPTTTTLVLDHDLRNGLVEPKVAWLQERLTELRFDPGPVDGVFGDATLRAVWAFEKFVLRVPRTELTGVVTPASWARMNEPLGIGPLRTPGGTHVEVYLPEQVAIVFADGTPSVITHMSSGEGVEWCDEVEVDNEDGTTSTKGICGRSITPGGVYHFERKVDGWRNAALGRLYNPVYFNYGIAIHGAGNVPAEPKSRGCVRIPMHIAEYFPDLVAVGDTVYVFDGVDEPEHYGAQLPVFDWSNPDYTTTTTVPASSTGARPADAPASTAVLVDPKPPSQAEATATSGVP